MEHLLRDLRISLRTLGRRHGFVAVAVATLALAIGANSAIFSVVRGVLLQPPPYPEPERLVWLWETDRLRGTDQEGASVADYYDLREGTRAFAALAVLRPLGLTLTGDGEPERLPAGKASSELFAALGLAPVLGRGFTPAEDAAGGEPVVVLSEGLWRRRFGADPDILGRRLRLDGVERTVVGVMPSEAGIPPGPEQLWIPSEFTALEAGDDYRGVHNQLVLARLAPGVPLETAQAEVGAVMARLERDHADDNLGRGARLVPFHEQTVGGVRPALLVLLAAVGAVLLIACANVANLMLARAAARRREIALRTALGASRRRVVQQLLVESLLLAAAGGGLGLLLATWGVDALVALGGAGVPRLDEVRLDGAVLAFTAALALATGLACGLLPALRASRPDLRGALTEGGRGGGLSARRSRLRRALVVIEVAAAVVLVIAAGLLLRSFWRVLAVDPGLDPDRVLVVDLELPQASYPFPEGWPVFDWPRGVGFVRALEERIGDLPGVAGATTALNAPLASGWTTRVSVVGQPEVPEGELDEARFRPVGPGWFRLLRIPLAAGREFVAADDGSAPRVAIVNQAFVRRYFPGGNPLGESINIFGVPREIVGVAGDVRFRGREADVQPTMYVPFHQNPLSALSLVVRAEGDPLALVPAVRGAIRALDPDLPLVEVATLEQTLAGSLAQRRFTLSLLALFAALALVLAAVGIYGTVALGVVERTHEIGVRLALGGDRGDVLRLVLGQGLGLTLAGVALGLAGALAVRRALAALLFEVGPGDPLTWAAVPAVLAAVALAASWLPARRATAVDPVVALHQE